MNKIDELATWCSTVALIEKETRPSSHTPLFEEHKFICTVHLQWNTQIPNDEQYSTLNCHKFVSHCKRWTLQWLALFFSLPPIRFPVCEIKWTSSLQLNWRSSVVANSNIFNICICLFYWKQRERCINRRWQEKWNEKHLQQSSIEAYTACKTKIRWKTQPLRFNSMFNGRAGNANETNARNILDANRTRCHLFAHRFTYATLYCQLHR